MTVKGTLSTGEAVELRGFDGNAIEAATVRPFAPGAPAALRLDLGGTELAVQVKCHGSRKLEDGRFLVRGRVISLTREDRERLLGALAAASDLTP